MMYKSKKWFCSFVILLLTTVSLWAQQTQEDVVYLENGSIIRGKVLEYNPKGEIKIEITGGSILVYDASQVVKMEKQDVVQKTTSSTSETKEKPKAHRPPSKGIYHSIMAGTLMGLGEWGDPVPGVSLGYTVGYNFHHLIGVGGGLGIMLLGEHPIIPIYANIRSYFLKTSASPFVDMNIGYGIALNSVAGPLGGGSSLGQVQTSLGGLYLRPSIGFRFPSRKRTHVTMDFGYVIQFAQYTYLDWNNNDVAEKRIFYRPSLRVGITF